MIRDDAIHDENFVKKYAEESGIELVLNRCDIPKFSKRAFDRIGGSRAHRSL